MRNLVLIVCMFLFAASAVLASELPLPEGWRQVTLNDLENKEDPSDTGFRKKENPSELWLSAKGDFDGNGNIDIARFATKNYEKECAIQVTFSYSENRIAQHKILFGDSHDACINDFAGQKISLIPKDFKHKNGGFEVGGIEVGGSKLYFWNDKKNRFDEEEGIVYE